MQDQNSSANWLKANNAKHLWHPILDPKTVKANPHLIIESGSGVRVTDIDGKVYLDGKAGLWCVNAGHSRPEIRDAIVAQLDKLQYYTLFPGYAHPPSIQLSVKLCELAAQEDMARVFYCSGGSDATESAMKFARQYWKLQGQPGKYKIFSFRNGYHGMHFGGTSASGITPQRPMVEPLVPGFFQVEFPYLYRNPFTQDPEELAALCATLLSREIEAQSPGTCAALIAEPVIGSGGVIVPPASFWPKLREICDRYGMLLIADEVITGFGRTGSMFGSRLWGVKPDIMCIAKALTNGYVPMGATLISSKVAQAWEREGVPADLMHGYTYSGHPLACAAALASLDLLVKEDFAANSAATGAYFLEGLKTLQDRHALIGDVRGIGLTLAMELVKDRKTKEPFVPGDTYPAKLMQACLAGGLTVRFAGNKLILSPPLIFTREHVDEAIEILDRAFAVTPWR